MEGYKIGIFANALYYIKTEEANRLPARFFGEYPKEPMRLKATI